MSVLLITLLVGFAAISLFVVKSALQKKRPSKYTVAFFHPYCNDGGGGERVLWCGVKAIQELNKDIDVIIYTGFESNITGDEILKKTKERFNISLPRTVNFIFLKNRWLVEDKTYPRFTLLGQSIGSMLLGIEALYKLNPHVYIDTMGYAFTYPLFKYLCNSIVCCYVHYPTISTDMLSIVESQVTAFNNNVSNSKFNTKAKIIYYKLFAAMYSFVGRRSQVVMVNSTWTLNHINSLWNIKERTAIVYPPCNTTNLHDIPISSQTREKLIISIGQFRPEKNHTLQVEAFHSLLKQHPNYRGNVKLILIGSSRNEQDNNRINKLKEKCKELKIEKEVEFSINVKYNELKEWLSKAMIGVHTMWNEHFGIGVVEFMASGVIPVAHNSAGPKEDIVIPYNKQITGYLATTADEYADHFHHILQLNLSARTNIQEVGRQSSLRFSDEIFNTKFKQFVSPVINVPTNNKN